MIEALKIILSIALIGFMAGNLLEMGLRLELSGAIAALRNGRFVLLSLLWSFVVCPAVAFLLARILPMPEPYGLGLIFLGLAPCAPFLPTICQRARGDLAYVAAFTILAAVGTVVLMPVLVPLLAVDFSVSIWLIAKPLVLYVALPLMVGAVVRILAEPLAKRIVPGLKWLVAVDTVIMIIALTIIYWSDMLNAFGTLAIGTQIIYYAAIAAAAYGLSCGLPHEQRVVVSLGASTRNIGAAVAPLFAMNEADPRAIAMCALAVPLSIAVAVLSAHQLAAYRKTASA